MREQNPVAPPPSARASALKTAAILLAYVVIFTGILAAAEQWTRPTIEASLAAEKMKFVNEVLPAGQYDNDLLADTLTLPPTPELGLKSESKVYRARLGGKPAALALEAVAPDGYAGDIRLILGITAEGTITGVRVTAHKETPGLGDYVDLKKDKNKARPWIRQFDGLNYPQVPDEAWKVKKDRGRFDSRTGATISPRAVVAAVHRAAQFVSAHKDTLFEERAK
ncbi:electron transport complex subunit G [Betaproteobacteria bacterium]|nr:electron transport complex subunit G [Betaproteobacteria bacterium]GHU12186.1 electron transport complex subunit G [Betaproteobacteria bacterium]GHU46370.1 electron transport complex subunit G [Betaproteobacteria bacterium]